jgi:regulator of sigma E protease
MLLTIVNYLYVGIFVLFFFGFCIFIHELGHFLAAKWRKMHIVAFSIGFKKMWGFTRNGIEYRIGYLPFGGYVDIPQLETSDSIEDQNGKKLPPIKPIDRIIVAFAGPLFNVLFGFALATFLWIHGIPQISPKMSSIKVAEITQNSPEYKAGLRKGDDIVKFNDKSFYTNWNGFIQKIIFTIGDVNLGVKKENNINTISYSPAINPNVYPQMAEEGLPYPFFKPEIPIIIQVAPNSPAAKEGLKSRDRIIKINDAPIIDYQAYTTALDKSNGKTMNVTILREGKEVALKITPSVYGNGNKYLIGITFNPDTVPIAIEDVRDNSPAEKANLKAGDTILKVNNITPNNALQFTKIVNNSKGKQINLLVRKGNKNVSVNITPRLYYNIKGISVEFYDHSTPWQQFINVIQMSYKSLQGIFSRDSRIKASHMSGPIGIVTVIGKAVYNGSVVYALNIITLITFSLALLNLLPLPVLDGGHILISIIEIIIGRSIPTRLLQPICMAFVILLIGLMIFVTFNDVNRITHFTKYFKSETKKAPTENNPKVLPKTPIPAK